MKRPPTCPLPISSRLGTFVPTPFLRPSTHKPSRPRHFFCLFGLLRSTARKWVSHGHLLEGVPFLSRGRFRRHEGLEWGSPFMTECRQAPPGARSPPGLTCRSCSSGSSLCLSGTQATGRLSGDHSFKPSLPRLHLARAIFH